MFDDRGTIIRAAIASLLLCSAAVSAITNLKTGDARRAGVVRAVPSNIALAHRAVADLNRDVRRP